MQYFKLAFVPIEYGERALTVVVPFKSESDMKEFYLNDSNQIIDYSKCSEADYREWIYTESKKKKYQKIIKQH